MNQASERQAQGLTAEQIVNAVYVSEVAIAAGGKAGAYTLSRMAGPPTQGRTTELWYVAGDVTSWRFGWNAAASSPAFSPDGTLLTFLSTDEAGYTQVFAMPGSGSERPTALTAFGAPITSYAWSPDGRFIAFTAETPQEVARDAKDATEGRDWQVPDARVGFIRLWVFDVAHKTYQLVYDEELGAGTFTWTPDSRGLVFQGARVQNNDAFDVLSEIYYVSLPEERPSRPHELRIWIERDGQLSLRRGHLGVLLVDPSGTHLAFLSAAWPQAPNDGDLFVVDIEQALQPAGAVAAFRTRHADYTACDVLAWVGERQLLFMAWQGLQSVFYLVAAEGSTYAEPRQLNWPENHFIEAMAFDPDSQELLVVANTPQSEAELYRTSLPALESQHGEQPQRLTWNNPWLQEIELPEKRPIAWPSGELEIQGVLILPTNYVETARYPLIVAPHGGPMSIWYMGWLDQAEYPVSMLAQEGYMVLLPNYRGSGGRGSAFAACIKDNVGVYDIEDLLAGISYLVERGHVDPDRVGILGHSYGGYLANWAATAHSPHFKAAVGISGITDWMSFIGTTDIPSSFSRELWGGWWFRQHESHLYWQRSPLRYVESCRTPLLMMHGEADTRVPTEQSCELFTSLHAAGRPRDALKLVLYPGEPHHISAQAHELNVIRRTINWFLHHLPPGAR